jgi:hypothetical protein
VGVYGTVPGNGGTASGGGPIRHPRKQGLSVLKKDDLLKQACERMQYASDADRANREAAMDDLRNLAGEQWPEDLRLAREAEDRLCVTINRLPQFLRQVTGDLRSMNPAIKVLPADSEAAKEGAEAYEGLIRQIQYASDATSCYEWAGESAAACGMGYFRILTEYEDENSFNLVARIAPIKNAFAVYFDPEARMPTREDAQWCFITKILTEKEFKDAYPGKAMADAETDAGTDFPAYWRDGANVIVAEYFWKEAVPKTISLMPDGRVVSGKVAGAIKTRVTAEEKVMWAKISGVDVLEGPQEWAGKHIPVVGVMGEEMHIGDRVQRTSVIRYAKEPQRLYNYFVSAETEVVALQPKAPFMVTPSQVRGLETIWGAANTKNRPYLPYNPDPNAPAPQRVSPPVSSSGMMQHIMMAADDMQATTGIFDAGLGQRSNEKSGVAIRQRQLESDVSTSIYSDNVAKAVAHCGRILVDMIPRIYDAQRMIRIIGQDDAEQIVTVNQQVMTQDGPMVMNDMTVGKYDVRVSVGPNYTTKRQETAESMMQFVQAFPAAAQVAGDLIAGAMDWPGADQIADRLKKTLPPGLVEEESPQAQQAQMQAQQVQQEQSDMAKEMAVLQLEEQRAKTEQAQANASKAQAEAGKAALELQGFGPVQLPYGA